MLLHALKQAVKKICPDFVMRQYRYYQRGKYLRAVNRRNREYVKLHMRVGGYSTY